MIEGNLKAGELVQVGEENGIFIDYISVWDNGHVEWGLHSPAEGMSNLELYQLGSRQKYSYRYVPVHVGNRPVWWRDNFHSRAIVDFCRISTNRDKLSWSDKAL